MSLFLNFFSFSFLGHCYWYVLDSYILFYMFPSRSVKGGLGHLAIQFSKAAGFYTIGITHSKDKEEFASKLGADMVVNNGHALKRAGGLGKGSTIIYFEIS
jgi:hypothetical protein